MLRCPLYDPVLNVGYGGDAFESRQVWESDPEFVLKLDPSDK
jgi:hypothetical protein